MGFKIYENSRLKTKIKFLYDLVIFQVKIYDTK